MVFQKKIIIGSVMSFIATAVGVIAVFFPDLLNLQKKKMENLDLTIHSQEQFNTFSQFISKREKDKKIFQLNLEVCGNIYFPDGTGTVDEIEETKGLIFGYMDSYFQRPTLTKFDMDSGEFASISQIIKREGRESVDSTCQESGMCNGTSYAFPEITELQSARQESESCSSVSELYGRPIISGYFVHEKTDYTRGGHEVHMFKSIPKESVILKDY